MQSIQARSRRINRKKRVTWNRRLTLRARVWKEHFRICETYALLRSKVNLLDGMERPPTESEIKKLAKKLANYREQSEELSLKATKFEEVIGRKQAKDIRHSQAILLDLLRQRFIRLLEKHSRNRIISTAKANELLGLKHPVI